jgi:hypothetical protein
MQLCSRTVLDEDNIQADLEASFSDKKLSVSVKASRWESMELRQTLETIGEQQSYSLFAKANLDGGRAAFTGQEPFKFATVTLFPSVFFPFFSIAS